jgi:hypothetical protein
MSVYVSVLHVQSLFSLRYSTRVQKTESFDVLLQQRCVSKVRPLLFGYLVVACGDARVLLLWGGSALMIFFRR